VTPLVIDCNFLCYKAMFSGAEDLTWEEKRTGIIFNFLLQIFKLAKVFETSRFIFCWDSRQSFRKKLYPEYKANRELEVLSPEEQIIKKLGFRQFDEIRCDVLPALGFKNVFIQTGYEGDDLIAAQVYAYPEMVVVGTDNDLWQLLDFCSMYDSKKKELFTKRDFEKKWGIFPLQWGEVKCLAGCSGDNVEGIAGVGNITAIKYLKGLLPDGGVVKERIDSKEGQKIIERNEQLVVLPPKTDKCNRRVDFGGEVFRIDNFVSIFQQYGFNSMINKTYLGRLKENFDLQ